MNRIFLCIIATMCTNSFGQTANDWVTDRQRDKGTATDYSARRTPIPETKQEEESIKDLEVLVETLFTQPDQEPSEVACDADISIEYTQMDDKVQIDAHISNQECPSSHGLYAIRVSTRDKLGEQHMSKHEESWYLDNASQSMTELMYNIGSDVELISVRVHGSAKDFCTCITKEIENIDTKQAEAQ